MRSVILVLCLGSAAAFTPSLARVRGSVVVGANSKAIPFLPAQPLLDGSMPGDYGFDPLGLSNIDPINLPQLVPPAAIMAGEKPLSTLYFMREAELKHGRLCMLALVGFAAVDNGLRAPGVQAAGLTSVTAHDACVANGSMGALLIAVSIFELLSSTALVQAAKGSGRAPGDFAFDSTGLSAKPENKARLQLSEIVHCRLAMLAFSGMVTQAVAVSDKFPYTGL
jgi:hypothetical protein